MKRSEMVEIIKQQLHGNSNYPDHRNEAEALLNVIEKAGMRPPSVSKEDAQAIMRVYVGGNFYQWDEDIAKDEKIQESKRRWNEARADKRPLRERLAERRSKNK